MRATKYRHYSNEGKTNKPAKTSNKSRKAVKAGSIGFSIVLAAAAFIVPTTTLAPGVEAYADSRVASYSVGDIDKFSSVITDNCVEVTTVPETVAPTTVEETTIEETTVEKTTEAVEETKPVEKESSADDSDEEESAVETSEVESNDTDDDDDSYSGGSISESYSGGGALVNIANPDYSYRASHVSLSAYDRAKMERLVMGEAGSMGYTGCALVAQSIRDAMVRSNTTSIDQIISEYSYFGSTAMEPNGDVKSAVSYIFDQDGIAVQHRVMCFYIGSSAWHETQTFLTEIGGVRFFDLNF